MDGEIGRLIGAVETSNALLIPCLLELTFVSGCNLHRALPQRGEEADRPVCQVRSACVHCTLPTTEACGHLCLCALVIWLLSYAAPGSYQSTLELKRYRVRLLLSGRCILGGRESASILSTRIDEMMVC